MFALTPKEVSLHAEESRMIREVSTDDADIVLGLLDALSIPEHARPVDMRLDYDLPHQHWGKARCVDQPVAVRFELSRTYQYPLG